MVAHLLRLKLTLLRNSLRRRPSQLIGLAFGVLYGGGAVATACAALIALRFDEPSAGISGPVITLGGSVLVLAWIVVPMFAYGTDPTLDPSRFATYAIPSRTLALGLAVSALVGLPALGTSLVAAMSIVTWSHSLVGALIAAVSAILVVATCILLSRVGTAWASSLLQSRRGRDAIVTVTMVLILGYVFGASTLGGLAGALTAARVTETARVISWTPLGWAWSAPWAWAEGNLVGALLRLALAGLLVALLGWAWVRATAGMVLNPRGLATVSSSERVEGLGLFGRLPAAPVWAIAARCLTMWRRDPRYRMSAVALPLVPLILLVTNRAWAGEAKEVALATPLVLAFFVGLGPHNDVAYDDSAFAAHVTTGVPGWADRLGRLVPYLVVLLLAGTAYVVAAGVMTGRWDAIPLVAGLTLGVAGAGMGIASLTSVLLPYPVPGPQDNPFSTPPGSVGSSFIAQMVFMASDIAVCAPGLALGLWWLTGGPAWARWASLAVSVVLGLAVLAFGIWRGGAYLDGNADRVLARVNRAQ
ncbi:MAG TPA: hypothetical protein PLQ23_12015 [Dermatophilaceae bacterium]|jgi:ABC-2 type transport system permease protein|nr:hypothetical protein [Dermatophilaceae bacterium]